jgi:hypothetical protein
MDNATNLKPGTPVFTADGRKIGHVAEVREDAFRIDVQARPDFWLALEDVGSVSDLRVDLRMSREDVGEHRVAEPVRGIDPNTLASKPLIGPGVEPGNVGGDPYLDIERNRIR